MQNVLVTGGKGFIGSPLVEQLKNKGYQVVVFDLPENDVTNLEQVKKAMVGKDTVFHLAGLLGTHELVVNSINAVKINIIGTLNILEAAKEVGAKVAFMSKPNCWLNTYTITKIAAESLCEMYMKEFGVKTLILKPFNVYGEGQPMVDYRKAVPFMITEALSGKPLTIYSDGEQTVDLVYVGDVAKAVILTAEKEEAVGKIIEIGSGVEMTVNDMAKLIIKLTGGKSTINHIPMRRGETVHTHIKADVTAMKEILGYLPETTLEDGMEKTIEFYRKKLESSK